MNTREVVVGAEGKQEGKFICYKLSQTITINRIMFIKYLLSVTGTREGSLTHLIFTPILTLLNEWKTCITERLGFLPKLTQLGSGRAENSGSSAGAL